MSDISAYMFLGLLGAGVVSFALFREPWVWAALVVLTLPLTIFPGPTEGYISLPANWPLGTVFLAVILINAAIYSGVELRTWIFVEFIILLILCCVCVYQMIWPFNFYGIAREIVFGLMIFVGCIAPFLDNRDKLWPIVQYPVSVMEKAAIQWRSRL